MADILIVDDNEDNRKVLARLLEYAGHRGLPAENGAEALALASLKPPDLVLMDLAMPEMDGWAATARFKSDPLLAGIPIIVVTGHVTSDEIGRAQQVGCQDVVSKPIDYYVLVGKIARYLAQAAPPAAPAGREAACPA
jgi:two-component system cell cycle response regulator DivK